MQITSVAATQPIQAAAQVEGAASCSGQSAAQDQTQQAKADAPGARLLNPQPTIDPALGIVVTEYFNQAGQLTSQYPSVKAIDSYRIHGLPDGSQAESPVTG